MTKKQTYLADVNDRVDEFGGVFAEIWEQVVGQKKEHFCAATEHDDAHFHAHVEHGNGMTKGCVKRK